MSSKIEQLKGLVAEVRGIISEDRAAEETQAREVLFQEAADDALGQIFVEADPQLSKMRKKAKQGDKKIKHQHSDKAAREKHKAGGGGAQAHKKAKGKFKKPSKMGPFKNRHKIGPARTGVAQPTKRRFAGYWSCKKVGPYKQLCKGSGGERKTVKIQKAYKKHYNKAYRKWLKSKKG